MKRVAERSAFILSILFLLATSTHAQGPATGTPPWGSFGGGPFDVINLGNLNVHFAIPIRHKAGRGLPLAYDVTYDSSIWYPGSVNGVTTWQPTSNGYWGWQGLSSSGAISNLTYSVNFSSGSCGQFGQYTWQQWQYTNLVYTDNQAEHPINFTPAYVQSNGPSGQCPPTGPQPPTETGIPFADGSGLTLYAQATSNSLQWNVTTASGTTFDTGVGGLGTDANGNQITASGGVITDTLGQTALTIAGAPPSNTTLSYAAPAGGTATYTMSYKQYTIKTNFGCSGISEYNLSQYLPDRLTLPDGTFYQFQYEGTAGGSGQVTGRLTSVTLPMGGSITYAYPTTNGGANNGINCSDGSAPVANPSLTRTVSPGGTWQYARTLVSGSHWQTTISDPSTPSNQTLIDLQQDSSSNSTNFFETERRVYQGSTSGTLLSTTIACYNTVNPTPANCPTSAVSNPISRRTVFSYLSSAVSETDTQYGYINDPNFPTEVDSYDYGAGGPGAAIRKVITQYNAYGNNVQPTSVQVQDGSGHVNASTTYTYDQGQLQTTSGTPQHTSVSGGRGNLTTIATQASGGATLYRAITYYDTGMMNTISDLGTAASGGTNITSYNFSSCGNSFVTSISEPMSLSRSFTWNCAGGVMLTATDGNGTATADYTTDPNFWRPDFTLDQLNNKTTLTYSANSTEAGLPVNGGNAVSDVRTTVDGFGRVVLTQKAENPALTQYDISETDYNALGQSSKHALPFQGAKDSTNSSAPGVTTTYDALGRTYQAADSGGGSRSYTYNGNDVLQTKGPAPSGENTKRRQLEYDGLGRVKSVCEVTSASGSGSCAQFSAQNGYLTEYGYDALGDLTGVVQNAQSTSMQMRTYSYDMLGRLTSEVNQENSTTANPITYTYDSDSTCGTSVGDLVKRVDAAGNITCYGYDALHRNTVISYPSGPYSSVTPTKYFVYDGATVNGQIMGYAKGRLAEAYTGSPSSKITDIGITYSPRGEVTSTWELTPHSGGYYQPTAAYWENGAIKTLWISQIPALSYSVDGEGRMSTVSASSGQNPVSAVSYNPAGQATGVTFGSGDSDTFTYDANTGRMTQYKYSVNGQAEIGNLGWNANWTLGTLGISDPINPGDTQNCSYGHDDLTRITSANCGSVWGQTFSYDAFGNIDKQVTSTGISWQPTYNTSTNHYASLPGFTPTYDANGNLTADSFHNYTWDAEGKVSAIDSTAYVFTYDAFGRNVEQNRSGTYYQVVYSPLGSKVGVFEGQVLQQTYWPLAGGTQAEYFSWGLAAYRHPDWLGSDRLESTTTKSVVSAAAYAPFGEPYAQSGSYSETSFAGANKDTLWLDYDFLFREYDPKQGRWISPDPAGLAAVDPTNPQTWNRYAYVLNNPLAMLDMLGEDGCYAYGGLYTICIGASACGWFCNNVNPYPGQLCYPGSGADCNPQQNPPQITYGCPPGMDCGGGGGGGGGAANNGQQPSVVQCANKIASGISIAGVIESGFDTSKHPYATWALDSTLGNTFAGLASIPEDFRTDPIKTYGDIVGGGLSQGLPVVGEALVKVGVPVATSKGLFGVATDALLAGTPLGLGKLGFDALVYAGSAAYCYAHR